MTTTERKREWCTVDKDGWGPGPWQLEPDKVAWVDPETGLDCMLLRHPRWGNWCGYVGVPPGHPLHGAAFSECPVQCDEYAEEGWCVHRPDSALEVHGGLTFAGDCHEPTREQWAESDTDLPFDDWAEAVMPTRICHVPEPGRPDDVWWLGFDCNHGGDHAPGMDVGERLAAFETYRERAYVEDQVRGLARQLAEVAGRADG